MIPMRWSYVYTHEHDLGLGHMYVEINEQLLICSLCDISYCENCGKEVTTILFGS